MAGNLCHWDWKCYHKKYKLLHIYVKEFMLYKHICTSLHPQNPTLTRLSGFAINVFRRVFPKRRLLQQWAYAGGCFGWWVGGHKIDSGDWALGKGAKFLVFE